MAEESGSGVMQAEEVGLGFRDPWLEALPNVTVPEHPLPLSVALDNLAAALTPEDADSLDEFMREYRGGWPGQRSSPTITGETDILCPGAREADMANESSSGVMQVEEVGLGFRDPWFDAHPNVTVPEHPLPFSELIDNLAAALTPEDVDSLDEFLREYRSGWSFQSLSPTTTTKTDIPRLGARKAGVAEESSGGVMQAERIELDFWNSWLDAHPNVTVPEHPLPFSVALDNLAAGLTPEDADFLADSLDEFLREYRGR
jgi:hypothetical protein